MGFYCFKCGKEQSLASPSQVGRRDSCACGADLHACKNCRHYDQKAYNECREPQAERVLEKDRSNFCDYFHFNNATGGGKKEDPAAKTKKALEDLFK